MNSEITWLIRIIAAHLLTDFVLQPDSWVRAKNEKHLRAKEFWYHAFLSAFFAVLFTGFDGWLWIAPLIFMSHCTIDLWKSFRKDSASIFILDQFFHILIIVIIWKIKFPYTPISGRSFNFINSTEFWSILIAIIFLTKPVGIVIGMLTKAFREKIDKFTEHTLEKAGTWIGILERLVIFFLVLVNQWDAIGLLVAAKSIIRLKDGDQKMSEYVLIGTLISISTAIITGFIVTKII